MFKLFDVLYLEQETYLNSKDNNNIELDNDTESSEEALEGISDEQIIEIQDVLNCNILTLVDMKKLIAKINNITKEESIISIIDYIGQEIENNNLTISYSSIIKEMVNFKELTIFDKKIYLDIEDKIDLDLVRLFVALSIDKQESDDVEISIIKDICDSIEIALQALDRIKFYLQEEKDPRETLLLFTNKEEDEITEEDIDAGTICNMPKVLTRYLINIELDMKNLELNLLNEQISNDIYYRALKEDYDSLFIFFQELYNQSIIALNMYEHANNGPIVLESLQKKYFYLEDVKPDPLFYNLESFIINSTKTLYAKLSDMINNIDSLVTSYYIKNLLILVKIDEEKRQTH